MRMMRNLGDHSSGIPRPSFPALGVEETGNTSRYLRPAWSPCGNYVAMGTNSPAVGFEASAIHVWDVRMLRSQRSSSHSSTKSIKSMIFPAQRRRLLATYFTPDGKTILSFSSDHALISIEGITSESSTTKS